MRIAVLWTHLSGYLNACLRELARINNVELFVAHYVPSEDSPFHKEQFSWFANRYEYEIRANKRILLHKLTEYQPDVLYVCSWHIPEYRFILGKFSGKAFRVLFMDNPWMGTAKQWLGVISSRWYLHSLYDAVFLPGEPQATFAKKLGFRERFILRGGNCCDHLTFAAVYKRRLRESSIMPKTFIYVGRLSEEKGVDVLAKAYLKYRSLMSNSWPLMCCGTGKLVKMLRESAG